MYHDTAVFRNTITTNKYLIPPSTSNDKVLHKLMLIIQSICCIQLTAY